MRHVDHIGGRETELDRLSRVFLKGTVNEFNLLKYKGFVGSGRYSGIINEANIEDERCIL